MKFGFQHILQERIYLLGQPTPSDHDFWRQCHKCGQVVPIYEAKKESMIKDFVETYSIPFDQGKNIVGLGNKKPKNRYQKQRQKLIDRIKIEKDEDTKQELRKANVVTIIEDMVGN